MADRHSEHASPVDHVEMWEHLRNLGWEDVRRRSEVYRAWGKPLGEETWSFGLWVAYATWTTQN